SRFFRTLAATPVPSLTRPRRMCSVPMYSWLKRWASWLASCITLRARSVKRSYIAGGFSDCPAPAGRLPLQLEREKAWDAGGLKWSCSTGTAHPGRQEPGRPCPRTTPRTSVLALSVPPSPQPPVAALTLFFATQFYEGLKDKSSHREKAGSAA